MVCDGGTDTLHVLRPHISVVSHSYIIKSVDSIRMSEILHRCNTLQTLEYLTPSTLSHILYSTIVFYS